MYIIIIMYRFMILYSIGESRYLLFMSYLMRSKLAPIYDNMFSEPTLISRPGGQSHQIIHLTKSILSLFIFATLSFNSYFILLVI